MDNEKTSCGLGNAMFKMKISFVNNNDMTDDEIKDFTEGLASKLNLGFSLNGTIFNPKETEGKYKEEMKEAKRKLNEAKNKKEKDKRQKKKDRYDRMMKKNRYDRMMKIIKRI